MIRAIIVDDEPLAREKVELFVRDEADIEVVAVCGNGPDAVEAYHKYKPNLFFLDIQMPQMNGFDVLQQLTTNPFPAIIFITAFDEFALRAFEFHALDYLLKPFNQERFRFAVNRAREILTSTSQSEISMEQIKVLLDAYQKKSVLMERLIVKTNGKIIFLKVNEIEWLEAAGNYIKLHVWNEEHLIRDTMNSIETQLDPGKFVRIHRSTIVNVEQIKEMVPWFNGEYKITLKSNAQVFLSRGFKDNFNKLLGKNL
ncbi:MAG: LytTR family DNA-binding domain-containing protein [Bacteroidota bacterium]|nr:LytTR family DNA-binding domain-containing protein [Bacteroidota bacterium]